MKRNHQGKRKQGKSKKKSMPKAKSRHGKATRNRSSHAAKTESVQVVPAGRGAKQLLNAVNNLVHKESAEIARTLVNKTVAGSASHARLVVDLSGAGGLASPPAKPRAGRPSKAARSARLGALTAADLSGSEENWEFDLEPEARPGYTLPKP